MDKSKETFLLEINKIVEDFFVECAYPPKFKERTRQMIDYIIPNYNKTMVPVVMLELSKIIKPNLTDEQLQMAVSLGWIYQMFEAYVVMQDDFIDEGDRRYGKTSWSKLYNHSKSVIVYDHSFLRSLSFFTIKRMFSHSVPLYLQLVDLFFDFDNTCLKANILDENLLIQNLREGKIELESLNMENYNIMATLKGTGIIFMPVALAMIISGSGFQVEKHSKLYKNIKSICDDLGLIAQVSDDYYDTFNPSSVTPSSSSDSDIRRGQFTWLFVMAMKKLTNIENVHKLIENYGRNNDESVVYVEEVYNKIGIHDLFEKYCEEGYGKIMKRVDKFFVQDELVHKMMTWYVSFIKKYLTDGAFGHYF